MGVTGNDGRALAYGIGLVLLANLLFSFVDVSTKWLLGAGLLVFQLAFMRYAVHFALSAAERLVRGRPAVMPRGVLGIVLLRSFCLVSATCVNFVGLGHLSLAVTSALIYLSPTFICLFASVLLGERITKQHWLAIALGLLGALIIVWPFGEAVNWYAVIMLYPATAIALYQVLTRKVAGQVRPGVLQLYTGAMGTIALAPFAAVHWVTPDIPFAWLLLIALGGFAWAGHEALTRAFAYAPAGILAPFGYSFVLYLTLAGLLFFEEVPGAHTLLGAFLIVMAGLVTWRAARTA